MPHTQLRALATRWATTTLGERQAFQSWFRDFCDALGVEQPAPHENGVYCFEQPVKVITNDGNLTTNFIDCWKAGHFAVEAKATGNGEGPNRMPSGARIDEERNGGATDSARGRWPAAHLQETNPHRDDGDAVG